jgi:hypothetical protein
MGFQNFRNRFFLCFFSILYYHHWIRIKIRGKSMRIPIVTLGNQASDVGSTINSSLIQMRTLKKKPRED